MAGRFRNGMSLFNTDFLASIHHGEKLPDVMDFSKNHNTKVTASHLLNKQTGLKSKTIKAQVINSNDVDTAMSHIFAEFKRNPQLISYCAGANRKMLARKLQESLAGHNIRVNIPQLLRKTAKLANLVSFIGSGVLEAHPNQQNRLQAARSVPKHHRIIMLSANMLQDVNCERVAEGAYLYQGRPAISAFSFATINALKPYVDVPGSDSLSKNLVKAYNIKKLQATDLTDETTEAITGERGETDTFLDLKRS